MRTQRLFFVISALLFTSFFYSCEPINDLLGNEDEEGYIYSESYQIQPFQVVELIYENVDLSATKYYGKLTDKEVEVFFIDEQLVFIAPYVPSGYHSFQMDVNGNTYYLDFEMIAPEEIQEPEEYLEEFIIAQEESITEHHTSLIENLVPMEEQSLYLQDLNTIQHIFIEAKTLLQTASDGEKQEAAQFLQANKADIDQLNLAINDYMMAVQELSNKNQKEVYDSEAYFNAAYAKFVAARIVLISQARKIVAWTATGAAVGSWFPVIGTGIGAAIGAGVGIGQFLLALQADDIATNQLTQFESIVDEISVDLNKTEITFNNHQKKTIDIQGSYKNLNSHHASSNSSNIQQFISYLSIFRNLFNQINDFLPESLQIKPKVISELNTVKTKNRPIHSKYISISNVSNSNISYSSEDLEGKIALTFSTEETDDQNFNFNIFYGFSGFSEQEVNQTALLSVDVDLLLGLWEAIIIDGEQTNEWRYYYYPDCPNIISYAILDILHTWEFTETTMEWYAKTSDREYEYTTIDFQSCYAEGMSYNESTAVDGEVTLYYRENNVLHISDGDEVYNFPIISLTNERLEVMGDDGLIVFERR